MSVAGIDVGDSSSCIALARKGGVDVLLNKESNRESPSVVTFTSKHRQMGTDAVGALSTNPANTVTQLKRLLGKKFSDPAVQKDLQYFPFKVVEGPTGECAFRVQYLDAETELTPEQLLAALLVDLREIAEKEQGAPVTEAVLSVPAYFTEPERHSVLAAAQVAGFNCLRLLNETSATALAYGIYKTDLPEDAPVNVVFVDVGFASTQVCVVALKKGQLQVLSSAWDRDLGGRDFDNALFEHFVTQFKERYKLDVKTNARACYRLRMGCEKVKKILTTNPEAPLNIECLMNDTDVTGTMDRDTFEELAKPVLERLLAPVQKALADAGLTADTVSSVEVVGGSSRVPAIAGLLTEFFGREPSRTLNAKETVARGCALQCAMLSPTFKVRDFQVLDSFPYGVQFSWEKDGEPVTSVVFEKGSHVPCAKMLTFYRSEPFSISAQYTPDSDIPPTADRTIGSFDVGPFTLPAGADKAKLKVKVTLNLNGVVGVENCSLIEEEEYEDEAAAAADQPIAEAAAQDGAAEAAAAGAEEAPMEAEVGPAAPKAVKKRTKKHAVPFTSHTAARSAVQLQKLFETECEMALQAKIQRETNDAKNAVEAYVYSLRNGLYDSLAPYVTEDTRSALSKQLEDMENWLYEEGEDELKSVYVAKLEELKKVGGPIEQRAAENSARPAAVASLRSACQGFLSALRDESKYGHLTSADREPLVGECQRALSWLQEKEALQQQLAKHEPPVLVSADVARKEETVRRVAEPILAKKPPPPPAPKKEEPAAAEQQQGEEGRQMETDAEPARADSPQESVPMDVDV